MRWWWCLAIVVLHAVASCGDVGSGPVRGFGSRQLLHTRDSTIRLWGRQGASSYVYSSGGEATPVPGSAISLGGGGTGSATLPGAVYWSVSAVDGRVDNLGTDPPGFSLNSYACSYQPSGVTEGGTATITDLRSGATTVIDRIHSGVVCPRGSVSTLVFLRRDPSVSGQNTLWTGPYDQLQPVAMHLHMESIVAIQFDEDQRAVNATVRAALLTGPPDRLGLFRIDLDTMSTAELVAPLLTGAAWAAGATTAAGQEILESTGLAESTSSVIPVARVGDHYVYERRMTDGGSVVFVGPLAEGPAREVALFRPASNSLATIHLWNPSSTRAPVALAWSEWVTGTAEQLLRFWDDSIQKMVTCSVRVFSASTAVAAPDGRRALFMPSRGLENSGKPETLPGPLLLVNAEAAEPCAIVSEWGTFAAFSPDDGTMLLWLDEPPGSAPRLWVSAADGSGARLLGTGEIDQPRFISDRRIGFLLGEDLVWLDLREDSTPLHYVAEKTFRSEQPELDWPWLVTGYQRSPRDGTGMLGLVNWETGAKRPISPSVMQYRYFWSPPFPSLPLHVLYQVRGRNPSTQDGLWLAEITAQDLQR